MSNNRLYIVDEDGDRFMVAKSFGTGWSWRKSPDEITEWLQGRDVSSFDELQPTELRLGTELDNEPE